MTGSVNWYHKCLGETYSLWQGDDTIHPACPADREISWNLEAARLKVKMFVSLWNLAIGLLTLLTLLSNVRAIELFAPQIHGCTRLHSTVSYRLVDTRRICPQRLHVTQGDSVWLCPHLQHQIHKRYFKRLIRLGLYTFLHVYSHKKAIFFIWFVYPMQFMIYHVAKI